MSTKPQEHETGNGGLKKIARETYIEWLHTLSEEELKEMSSSLFFPSYPFKYKDNIILVLTMRAFHEELNC